MKKILSFALFSILVFNCAAQSLTEDETIESVFGVEKLEIVSKIVNPRIEHKDIFLKIYYEYEENRLEISKEFVHVLNDYVSEWESMSDEQADELMVKVLDLTAQKEELIRTYYAKVKEEAGAKLATQFYQAERYIMASVIVDNYMAYPFLGEGEKKYLDEKKKKKKK